MVIIVQELSFVNCSRYFTNMNDTHASREIHVKSRRKIDKRDEARRSAAKPEENANFHAKRALQMTRVDKRTPRGRYANVTELLSRRQRAVRLLQSVTRHPSDLHNIRRKSSLALRGVHRFEIRGRAISRPDLRPRVFHAVPPGHGRLKRYQEFDALALEPRRLKKFRLAEASRATDAIKLEIYSSTLPTLRYTSACYFVH